MISGVTKQVCGASETFRMTTRAMMGIEGALGAGIVDVMQDLEAGFRVGTVATILAECADNGAGRGIDWAQDAIDDLGLEAAGELLGEIAEAAFPEAASKGSAAKNAKRAVPARK